MLNKFYHQLVIHTPHAGTILPFSFDYNTQKSMIFGMREIIIKTLFRLLTDHYTDKLFCSGSPFIRQLSFPYSRLFCDVERLLHDPLEERGLGICYDIERYIDRDNYDLQMLWAMNKEQAMLLYKIHHQTLSDMLRCFGPINTLVIDGHSFSE